MNQLTVNVSPHIFGRRDTKRVMLDVVIALLPAAIASVLLFGIRALGVIAVCVASAVVSEAIFCLVVKKPMTVGDLSAVITGLLLALNLPATIPFWQAALGSAIAIVVVKMLFGGLGANFANPAITARIALLLSFSETMAVAVHPVGTTDLVSGATPLAMLGGAEGTLPSMLDMFLGRRAGALGETCILALLIGGAYLLVRRVITWHTPVAFIGTVFLASFAIKGDLNTAAYQVLSGGLVIGAFFMATDYATSPMKPAGKLIFGVGCGLITVLIRLYGSYPGGISYAILFMNILTPFIDKWTANKPLGKVEVKK